MVKKVLITGGTGLIGKEALPFLIKEGFDVYATSLEDVHSDGIHWIDCDLFNHNHLKEIFAKIKPEYLLNFAWITGGDYLTNEKNVLFKDTDIKMLEYFKQNGGKRAVYAGTCFEYDITGEMLKETSHIAPKTLYAKCKNELHELCEKYAKDNDLSFGWGRIFYVFGHNENPSRLTAQILKAMKNNESFELGAPNNLLDYMYTKDIAAAFVKFLISDYTGSVNICTGKGILLKDYALKIQELCGKKDLIKFDPHKPASIICVGDNCILKDKIRFTPNYSTEQALEEITKFL